MRRDVAANYLKVKKEKKNEREASVSQNWIITPYNRSRKKTMQPRSNSEGVGEKKRINSCAKLEKNLTEWSLVSTDRPNKTELQLSYIPERKIVEV